MRYIIMLLIVVGLAASDFVTGFIKGCVTDRPRSKKMRIGGLEIGIETLGEYYQSQELAEIAGSLTAISVFIYITLMEVVSILENYSEINPDADWIKKLIDKFKKR